MNNPQQQTLSVAKLLNVLIQLDKLERLFWEYPPQ